MLILKLMLLVMWVMVLVVDGVAPVETTGVDCVVAPSSAGVLPLMLMSDGNVLLLFSSPPSSSALFTSRWHSRVVNHVIGYRR